MRAAVVAELACVMVNDPLATALTYMVPLPTSVAAFAVTGVSSGVDPTAQFVVSHRLWSPTPSQA